jgi:ubiquinol-cytochrome c reductase iron-sulfur subunit
LHEAGVHRPRTVVLAGTAFLLAVTVAASVLYIWAYWFHWSNRWLGAGMGIALLALGVALVAIAHRVLPHGTYVEPRPPLASSPTEQLAFELDFTRGSELGRRRFLWYGVAAAFLAFGGAVVAGVRSFGPRPDFHLVRTPWRAGMRVVTDRGDPIVAADVPIGGAVAVFPDGFPDSADGQAILVRVAPGAAAAAKVPPAQDGIYVYSKVCTHMGCPVSQYLAQSNQLMCPCHQSIFDVLDGGRPTFGPAARPLPMLPIRVDGSGHVVAAGDFPAPVGPSFWNLS